MMVYKRTQAAKHVSFWPPSFERPLFSTLQTLLRERLLPPSLKINSLWHCLQTAADLALRACQRSALLQQPTAATKDLPQPTMASYASAVFQKP
jgi:hypothetical protein